MKLLKQNWFTASSLLVILLSLGLFVYFSEKKDKTIAELQSQISNLSQELSNQSSTTASTIAEDNAKIGSQSGQISNLNSRLSNQSKGNVVVQTNLSLKRQCATDAATFFDEGRYSFANSAIAPSYISHYNVILNECLISITFATQTQYVLELYDAVQGSNIGMVAVTQESSGLPQFASSSVCIVVPFNANYDTSPETCSSLTEYQTLTKPYFNN